MYKYVSASQKGYAIKRFTMNTKNRTMSITKKYVLVQTIVKKHLTKVVIYFRPTLFIVEENKLKIQSYKMT